MNQKPSEIELPIGCHSKYLETATVIYQEGMKEGLRACAKQKAELISKVSKLNMTVNPQSDNKTVWIKRSDVLSLFKEDSKA